MLSTTSEGTFLPNSDGRGVTFTGQAVEIDRARRVVMTYKRAYLFQHAQRHAHAGIIVTFQIAQKIIGGNRARSIFGQAQLYGAVDLAQKIFVQDAFIRMLRQRGLVAIAVQQHTMGGLSITPGPPDLLVIGFYRIG